MVCCTTDMFHAIEYFRKLGGSTYLFFVKTNSVSEYSGLPEWELYEADETEFYEEGWFWGLVLVVFALAAAITG
eukprot:CAMPEP_0198224700 /NCGR_PEP_ID=MMETSP1445-20131203/97979_1 /TAXON_ID=36898 /ORGANISM="Pyramimonas sp., Strain CCMP2087" /LENGTH=73 /DNA_ID=CAMNT_0043903947 /DNA_START=23 /DNA_END=240 /DNA_ORIENTATION=+